MLAAKDRLEAFQIECRTHAVDQTLKELFQLPAFVKEQIAAQFNLKNCVLVLKVGLALFGRRQGKIETSGVKPTLADLAQMPYRTR